MASTSAESCNGDRQLNCNYSAIRRAYTVRFRVRTERFRLEVRRSTKVDCKKYEVAKTTTRSLVKILYYFLLQIVNHKRSYTFQRFSCLLFFRIFHLNLVSKVKVHLLKHLKLKT